MSVHTPTFSSGDSTPGTGPWKRLWNFLSRRVLRISAERFSMQLDAGQQFRLYDAAGWTIACGSGSVWITQEADIRDVFLNAGERFTLDRGGLTLMLARKDSALALRPPARGRSWQTPTTQPDAGPASDSGQEVWLRAVYPDRGPWNDPAAYRRSGLL